ncbi:uncharacterized protein ACHE_10559A [Aspergillus chevalieri]|uniref:Uncharacterized protein n=1 Tax=Aspergillus chevalieri TaxID=182096 RepID=A0A7R7VE61_ASPCH|nr:uncharacterized protein ACHE_10559A [Aspergillus chevalieri]BCR83157.1 hypothetical protein ACHE_10559A [Aspergillus chevalieri]
MAYQGLESVKQQFLSITSHIDVCKKQGRDPKLDRYSIVFQGNLPTGKTTIGRLYAKFLYSIGVLGSCHVIETSGVKLASEDPK